MLPHCWTAQLGWLPGGSLGSGADMANNNAPGVRCKCCRCTLLLG